MTRRALAIGCGGVAGAAWTTAMLAGLAEATGWDPRTADILTGTSSGAVMVALLGGGISVERMMHNQRTGLSHTTSHTTPHTTQWNHDRSSGRHLPPLPGLPLPGAPQLALQGLRGRVSAMTALSGLLPKGRLNVEPLAELINGVATQDQWVSHPATWVVAVDDQSGERVAFGSPTAPRVPMSQAVCASCAIPGWVPPIRMAGRRWLDGGIASSASVDMLADTGVEEVVLITPMVSRIVDTPRALPVRIERLLRSVMTRRTNTEVAMLEARGIKVLRLEPALEDLDAFGSNMMDPRRRVNVFDTAVRTAPGIVRQALQQTPLHF